MKAWQFETWHHSTAFWHKVARSLISRSKRWYVISHVGIGIASEGPASHGGDVKVVSCEFGAILSADHVRFDPRKP